MHKKKKKKKKGKKKEKKKKKRGQSADIALQHDEKKYHNNTLQQHTDPQGVVLFKRFLVHTETCQTGDAPGGGGGSCDQHRF